MVPWVFASVTLPAFTSTSTPRCPSILVIGSIISLAIVFSLLLRLIVFCNTSSDCMGCYANCCCCYHGLSSGARVYAEKCWHLLCLYIEGRSRAVWKIRVHAAYAWSACVHADIDPAVPLVLGTGRE